MGMPDVGYIEHEMFTEVFDTLPDLAEVAWANSKEGGVNLEFRFGETFDDVPYNNGKTPNKDDKGLFEAVARTLRSFWMLRGYEHMEEEKVSTRYRKDFQL
jgi:hypothetical protein